MRTSAGAFSGRRKLSRVVDITPLIDVVFQLLLFFMLTSAMVVQQGLDLSLPEAESSQSLTSTPIEVDIPSEGPLLIKITDNDNANKVTSLDVPDEKLSDFLLTQGFGATGNPAGIHLSSKEVIIRSDAAVPVRRLVSVMDILRENGLDKLSLATDTKSKN